MNKVLFIALFWLFSFPAFAADNAVVLTAGSGVTMRTKDVGTGIQSPLNILGDTSGNPLATVPGTPNAVFALPIQGVTGGTAVPVSLTSTTITGTVAATQSGTWNITNISGTVSLPTGAGTSANQSTIITALGTANTSLSTIATNTGLGALVDESNYTEASTSNIMMGAYYKAAPTPLTTGQSGAATLTQGRALISQPYADPANFSTSGVTAAMTGTSSTSLLAAPSGSLHNYLTHIVCTNSHATTGTFILIQDGSGGTTIYEAYAAPVGGGFSLTLPMPLRQPTAATALFVQNVTTSSNTICAASGFKAL